MTRSLSAGRPLGGPFGCESTIVHLRYDEPLPKPPLIVQRFDRYLYVACAVVRAVVWLTAISDGLPPDVVGLGNEISVKARILVWI